MICRCLSMAYNINTLFYIGLRAHTAWSLRGNVLSVQTSHAEGIPILILIYILYVYICYGQSIRFGRFIHCPDILYNALRILGNIENGLDDLMNNDKS